MRDAHPADPLRFDRRGDRPDLVVTGVAPDRREPRVSDSTSRPMPDARRVSIEDFRNVCFVIMPFGTKEVGSGEQARTVDFDAVYESLFRPAVEAVVLPEAEAVEE